MKKLNLKMKGIGEMLSKEQMKNVVGGNYGNCPQGQAWHCPLCPQPYICSSVNPSGLGGCTGSYPYGCTPVG